MRSRIPYLWSVPEEQDARAVYLRGWLSVAAAEYSARDDGFFGGCCRGRGRGRYHYHQHSYCEYSTSTSTSSNRTSRSKHRQHCQFRCQYDVAPNRRSHARPHARLGVNSLGWWSPSAISLLGARMHGRRREERPFPRDGAGRAQSCCQPGAVREYRRVTASRRVELLFSKPSPPFSEP